MSQNSRIPHVIPDGHVLAEPHWNISDQVLIRRRRRLRNRALLAVLAVLVALFYAITIAKTGG